MGACASADRKHSLRLPLEMPIGKLLPNPIKSMMGTGSAFISISILGDKSIVGEAERKSGKTWRNSGQAAI